MLINENTKIFGKTVVLVPYRKEHVPIYHEWMKDPNILEMTCSEPLSLDEEYEMQEKWQKDDDKCTFILRDRATNKLCGDVNLFMSQQEDNTAEIEVMVAETESQRKGIATEAINIMMWYGYTKLHITTFLSKILSKNVSSIALFTKIGYTHHQFIKVFNTHEYIFRIGEHCTSAHLEEEVEHVLEVPYEPKRLSGRKISKEMKKEGKARIEALQKEHNTTKQPGLAVILVGNRPDSAVYVRQKKKAAKLIGIANFDISLKEDVSEKELLETIHKLNERDDIHGILVQLPLPSHINEEKVLSKINLEKDVDGFHTMNMGLLAMKNRTAYASPCTPAGCMELLKRYDIDVRGKNVVVLGRSNIVGIPIALMMMHASATVTICHSQTVNLEKHVKSADIVIAAIGKPHFVKATWLKNYAVVIDVGINSVPVEGGGYKIVGDVDYDEIVSKEIVHLSAITPVPGGVGPMTIAMLMHNTINAFERSLSSPCKSSS